MPGGIDVARVIIKSAAYLDVMELLKVGDRVENRSGWTGTVVEVDDTNATVRFDNGEPSGRFGRDAHHYEGGVLRLI